MKNFIKTIEYKHVITVFAVFALISISLPSYAYAGNFFSDLFGDITKGTGQVLQGTANVAGDVWKGSGQVLTQVGQTTGDVWKGTGQVLQGSANVAGDVWKGSGQVLTQVGSWGGDVWNGAGQAATQVGSWGGDVWKGSGQVATAVGGLSGDVWNGVSNTVSNATGDVGNWFGGSNSNSNYNNYNSNSNNQITYSNQNYNNQTSQNNNSGISCNGGSMSFSQYRSAQSAGLVSASLSVNGSTVTAYFTNNTDCSMQVSVASYKMYGQGLANQRLFATANGTVSPHSSLSLSTSIPSCMAQLDAYFGSAGSTPVNDADVTMAGTFVGNNSNSYNNASGTFCSDVPPPTPGQNLQISCYANPGSVQVGNTVNWYANTSGGNGSYVYSWSGTDGLSGSGTNVSKSYSYTGNKSAMITVTSGGQTATANCYANVYQVQDYSNYNYNYNYNGYSNYYPYNYNYNYGYNNYGYNYNNLDGSCSAVTTNSNVGNTVQYYAMANGGDGYFTYYWYDDEGGLTGNAQYAARTYSTPGTKVARVTITSAGHSITRSCYANVGQVQVLAYSQTSQPTLASVYLSQVPYTGAGDVFKVVSFITFLAIWSGAIAYIFLRRKERVGLVVLSESDGEEKENSGVNDGTAKLSESISQDEKDISAVEDYARTHKILLSSGAVAEVVKSSRFGKAKASDLIKKIAEDKRVSEDEWVTVGDGEIEKYL
jgi:hypothetical protein